MENALRFAGMKLRAKGGLGFIYVIKYLSLRYMVVCLLVVSLDQLNQMKWFINK